MVDKATKEKLLDLIRKSREQELLFLRTVRDAAILAGEQVQDKRLDFLDHPPDVEATPFMVDFLISLALGPVASAVINSFVSRGLKGILRNRGLAFEETTSKIVLLEKTLYVPEHIVDQKKAEYNLWTRFAERIQKIGEVGVDVAAKRLQQPKTVQGNNNLVGDTASVAVRRAAMSFVRLHQPVVILIHEHYKNLVETGEFNFEPEVFIRFQNNNIKFPKNIKSKTNNEIEKRLSLFFEACIWLLHFTESGGINKQLTEVETHRVGGGPSMGLKHTSEEDYTVTTTILSTKRPVVVYWLNRFPHPEGDGRESFLSYYSNNSHLASSKSEVEQKALKDLQNWFGYIESGMVNLQKLGVDGLEIFGPVKPK